MLEKLNWSDRTMVNRLLVIQAEVSTSGLGDVYGQEPAGFGHSELREHLPLIGRTKRKGWALAIRIYCHDILSVHTSNFI